MNKSIFADLKNQHLNSTISSKQKQSENQKILNKTIQQPIKSQIKKTNQPIVFWPQQIQFSCSSVDCQIKELFIQNVSSVPLKVKLIKPITSNFQILSSKTSQQNQMLCPGLTRKIEIQFKKKNKVNTPVKNPMLKGKDSNENNFYDTMKIVLQNKKYEVNLKAIKSKPQLQYESVINLNFVDMNKLIKILKPMKNKSNETVKIKIIKQSWQNMHISPTQFFLKPMSQQMIQFSVTPTTIGAFHHKILIEANGQCSEPIQIIYSTFDYNYSLVDEEGNKISQLNFGYMFYGSKKSIRLFAVNNSPNSVQMKGKIRTGWKSNPLESIFQSPQEFGQECSSTIVEMTPKSIKLKPFSKQQFWLSSYRGVTQDHLQKVNKFGKDLKVQISKFKTHKRIMQLNQKYKIQDDEYHQSFISEFNIMSNDLNNIRGGFNLDNQARTSCYNSSLITQLKMVYGLPALKIQPAQFDLGKIIISKPTSRKIKIKSLNQQLSLNVKFNKTLGVQTFPKEQTIAPNEFKQFQIYVTPVNLGPVSDFITFNVNGNYKFDCKITYEGIADKSLMRINKIINKVSHKSLHLDNSMSKTQQQLNFTKTLQNFQKTCHNQFYRYKKNTHSSTHTSAFKIRKNATLNQLRYSKEQPSLDNQGDLMTSFLRETHQRNQSGSTCDFHQQIKKKKTKKIDEQEIQDLIEHCDDVYLRDKFVGGIPNNKDNLFVTKKIDKYQPYALNRNTRKLLKSKTSKQFFSNAIKRGPRNRREADEVATQLDGQALKLIGINTKIIHFGKMFVGSKMTKQFIIQNGTQYSIEVKLKSFQQQTQLEKLQHVMLSQTDFQQQVISPHSAGNFKIVLFAKQCGKFEKPITYTINKIHQFQFLVQAQIQLATLTVNKNNLKLAYQDDITQMFLKDNFILKNDGNAATEFNITQLQKNFIIQPSQGIVYPGDSAFINVIYNSPNPNVINAGQPISTIRQLSNKASTPNQYILIDQRINVQIKNGVSLSLRATSNPNLVEPKCFIKQNKINFGVTIVSKAKSKSFLLRNTGRNMVLFEIQNNQCSEYLFFQTTKGKLPPQSSKQITVTYKSSMIQSIAAHFKVIIRGGLIINVPISAQSVAPNIHILQDNFNFGDVCCGTVSVKPVTITNQSQTMVELLLDLVDRRAHGMEYLYVSFLGNQNHTIVNNIHEQNDISKQLTLKSKNSGRGSSFQPLTSNKNNQNYFSQDQSIIDNAHIQPQIHKLKVAPKSNLIFYILFKPKLPGFYQFQLPIYLENFIKNDSLTKIVTCFATEPKFIVEPSVVKFKKKIINDKQSTSFHPLIQFITLKNPGDKELKWKIDYPNAKIHQGGSSKSFGTSGSILANSSNNMSLMSNPKSMSCEKFCFQIQNKKGEVKPSSWQCINISFNPFQAGTYCYKLPLLIYNEQRGMFQQQAQIRLEGQGQYPSIFFDRKELILPVVPLGIESVGMFKVINEGYESLNLKHRVQIFDLQGNCIVQGTNLYNSGNSVGIPQINIIYPQGTKMGVNKKQLYVIVKFISKKPISFTCKLQLFDNGRDTRVYSLPISGTADNSIMTIFPYLNDSENRFKYHPSLLNAQNTPFQKQKSGVFQNYTINIQSTDQRNIIDKIHNQYEKMNPNFYSLDCQIIRRWMNSFLKDQKIGKFPEDVINSPENLLKILTKMTSKKQFDILLQVYGADHSQNINTNMNKANQIINRPNLTATLSGNAFNQILSVPQQINSKIELYQYLIKLLKSMGCLLNHIRPYFLLGKQQFFSQIQKDSNWKNMSQNYTKYYKLMHLQSWIVLFYQIINHFWYNTSKLKTLFSTNQKQTNSIYPSNIYSQTELSVLKWIKSIYQKYNQFQDSHFRFLSFNQDFKDCLGPIYSIYHHIVNPLKKKKSLQGLSKKPSTANELQNNVKILYQLFQKTGLIPLIFEDQYLQIRQKQMFLFLFQLYELLPQQLPKSQPILFSCNLGEKCCKFVQIKNPSNKTVHYWIKLQGSRDFSHEQKQFIKIQPKSVYKFKVVFQSRISEEQIAYLTFLNKQETEATNNTVAGTTLVFQLKSKILGRKSIKKIEPIHCQIYQTQTIRIPVQNYFDQNQFGNFDITLVQEVVDGNQDQSKNKLFPLKKSSIQAMTQSSQQSFQANNQRQRKPRGQENTKILNQIEQPQSINFFVDVETIKIKRKTISYLQLMFNPIVLKKIRCYIIFNDPLTGEFQYQIIGMPQIPKILHQIRYPTTLYTGTKQTIQINLPVYNNYMIKSNVLMQQKLYSKNGRNKTLKKQERDFQIFKIQINMDQKILQYVTFPSQHIIKNAKKQQSNAVDLINKMKIDCYFPVVIKDLSLDFLLINEDRRDIRRIKLGLNLASKPIQSDLIISTTARIPIVQPIPIENTSNKDWRIKATLVEQQDDQGFEYFSLKQGQKLLSKDFVVKKTMNTQLNTSNNLNNNSSLMLNQSSNVQVLSLVFNPQWTCKTQCRLTIQNVTTNQQLVYFIKGVCEEPISEQHLYLKMQTGAQFTKIIKIKNPYNQALDFTVQTDLDQLKINPSIHLEANQEMNYKIQAFSKTTNSLVGFLKFTDYYNRFFWYTVTVQSYDNNHYQQKIELSSTVQRQVQRIIQVKNPTNTPITFKAEFDEKLGLIGEQKFSIEASSSHFYKLRYKPKTPVRMQTQLKFSNKTLGCYIYQVMLLCQQNQKRKIQTMNTEVGKTGELQLDIQNNLNNPIQISCQISNTKYFQVFYNQVLPAQSQNSIKVVFKPLEQGQQNCILKVYGQQFQTKCYQIQANGLAPFSIETIEFKTQLFEPILEVIKFKNPNPKNAKEKVKIILEDIQTKHNSFKIVEQGQKNVWQTQVKDILGIPIQFVPNAKGCFESMLIIQCFHYQWKYLLKGLTNSKIDQVAKEKIQTECRKEAIKIIKIPVPDYIKKQSKFDLSQLDRVELEHNNPNILKNIKAWTGLRLQNGFKQHQAMINKYSSETQIQISSSQTFTKGNQKNKNCQNKQVLEEDQITLYVKFLPQKPMDQTINLVIYNSKNQIIRINYKLRLMVHPSKPDKMLKLQINSIKKHKFEINIDQLQLFNTKPLKKNILGLLECKMQRKEFVDCKLKENSPIIQINFNPNNLTFTKNKQYSDVLMVSSDKQFWSFQVVFKLINIKNKK